MTARVKIEGLRNEGLRGVDYPNIEEDPEVHALQLAIEKLYKPDIMGAVNMSYKPEVSVA